MAKTFTLRLITRQAGGGEIVRTRTLEWPDVLVGRAPDNDIVLADLSIDLQHARISYAGAGVLVEAVGETPFLADGKPTLRAHLDPLRQPVLGFGDYEIALQPGEDEDETVLVVTRREADHAPGVSLFSLRADVFGRRRMAWILGIAIVALCLLVPALGGLYVSHLRIHPDRQWSSGPLSQSHAFLEHDCQSCHAKAFVAVRDEACLTCHQAGDAKAKAQVIAFSKKAGGDTPPLLVADHAAHDRMLAGTPAPTTPTGMVKGFMQMAFNHPGERCASCHLEHVAAPAPKDAPPPAAGKPPTVNRPAIPTLAMANDCAGCHAALKARLPSTTLVDVPDWGRHPDFRPLVMQSPAGPAPRFERVALSARPQEHSGLIFSHKDHLDRLGGVARQAIALGQARGYGGALDCQSCHRPDASGAGFKPIEMERDCEACHSLDFATRAGVAQKLVHGDLPKMRAALDTFYGPGGQADGVFHAALKPGGACIDCHTITWDPAAAQGVRIAPTKLATRYLPRGDFDHSVPAHRGVGAGAAPCEDCHKASQSDRTEDLLLPPVSECATCHGKTVHQTPAAARGACADCHSFHKPGAAMLSPQDKLLRAIHASWDTLR